MMQGVLIYVPVAALLVVLPSEISALVLSPKKGQKLQRWQRHQHGVQPAPAPRPERGEAVNGHWVKEAGPFGDWHKESENVYRKVPGVGNWGGTCTCPDGEVYEVGDMGDSCAHLACEGGQSSDCTEGGISQQSFGMMVTCARAPLGKAGAHPGEHHHSVFQLHLESLDNLEFWRIFICMIVFALCIDQAQEYLNHKASTSPTTLKFLERVYGELMLFGIVALSIFIIENFVSEIDEGTHLILEFVDILCSVGAISLILFASVIYLVLIRDEKHWRELENETTSPLSPEAESYHSIADFFKSKHGLSRSFPMYTYLKRTLVAECIRIMRVEWTSWLLFMLLPIAGYIYRQSRKETLPDVTLLFMVTYANWALFLLHLVILGVVQYAHASIEECVAGEPAPVSRGAMKGIAISMHVAAIVNSFLLAFFVMTITYNAQFTGRPAFWVAMDGVPLLVDTVVLLPSTLTYFSLVQAFYCPQAEIIGEIMEEGAMVDEDLAFLRNASQDKEFAGSTMMNFKDFRNYLRSLKIHMTTGRMHRLFSAIDKDGSGEISQPEFKKFVRPDLASS